MNARKPARAITDSVPAQTWACLGPPRQAPPVSCLLSPAPSRLSLPPSVGGAPLPRLPLSAIVCPYLLFSAVICRATPVRRSLGEGGSAVPPEGPVERREAGPRLHRLDAAPKPGPASARLDRPLLPVVKENDGRSGISSAIAAQLRRRRMPVWLLYCCMLLFHCLFLPLSASICRSLPLSAVLCLYLPFSTSICRPCARATQPLGPNPGTPEGPVERREAGPRLHTLAADTNLGQPRPASTGPSCLRSVLNGKRRPMWSVL